MASQSKNAAAALPVVLVKPYTNLGRKTTGPFSFCTGVFLWNLENFYEYVFPKIPPKGVASR